MPNNKNDVIARSDLTRQSLLPIIAREANKYGLAPDLICAQIQQESAWNPKAVSPCGARGLMQLMGPADKDIDKIIGTPHVDNLDDLFDPEINIREGVGYLALQITYFPEIPNLLEQVKFALGSYNGGVGYLKKALDLAKTAVGKYNGLHADGSGYEWQIWSFTSEFLRNPLCQVHGRHPDADQIINYVRKIIVNWLGSSSPEIKGGLNEK